MRKNCKTFEQWIESMYQDFKRTEKHAWNLVCILRSHGDTLSCTISSIRTGWSACQRVKLENHNLTPEARCKAIALAWASYCCEPIPDFREPVHIKDVPDQSFFEDFNGKEWFKIGFNPRTNRYVCIPVTGAVEFSEKSGMYKVYLPR